MSVCLRRPKWIACAVLFLVLWGFSSRQDKRQAKMTSVVTGAGLPRAKTPVRCDPELTVVTVSCGNDRTQQEQLYTSVKTMLLFTSCSQLRLIVFTDMSMVSSTKRKLEWLLSADLFRRTVVNLEVRPAKYPDYLDKKAAQSWRTEYRLCSTYRLFLTTILPLTDAVIYLDSDTVLMSPIELLWTKFYNMTSSQHAAFGREPNSVNLGWYQHQANIPYVPPSGLNGGVALLNLTRLRSFKSEKKFLRYYSAYKHQMTLGDQDLINIIFYHHPDRLMVLPVEWNFMTSYCGYCDVVPNYREGEGLTDGAAALLLHGTARGFHDERNFHFYRIYQAVSAFRPHRMSSTDLPNLIRNGTFSRPTAPKCVPLSERLAENVERFLQIKYM